MSVTPFTAGRFRALDSNGNPLSGGLLYTYAAGTTTPQSTYITSALTIANANPVVLDATGEADVWLSSALGNYKFILKDSGGVTQWTEDNWVQNGGSANSSANPETIEPGGRLTLTAGTPVSDATGATTIYYAPYKHDKVPLYDGAAWALYSIGSGISQATADNTKSPAAMAASSNYDLFIWNDNGTVRLSRGYPWTSDTARGTGVGTTELTQQNGRWVNKQAITNGPAASCGLYVGTIRSDGSAHANDMQTLRCVWNNYNRVTRTMSIRDNTASWNYNTAAWRQANANAANQFSMVFGMAEDSVSVRTQQYAQTTSDTVPVATGVGADSTTALAASCITAPTLLKNVSPVMTGNPSSSWEAIPGLGFHYLAWLEYGAVNAGNTQFLGSGATYQSGMLGFMRG